MKELFSAYRLPIIIVSIIVLVLSCYFGGKHIYNSIYENGYIAGKTYEAEQNKKAQDQAKDIADKDRQDLNNKLDAINGKYQDLLAQRASDKKKQQELLNNYKKSVDAAKKCLDNGIIDIYNNSLPRGVNNG